MADPQISGSTNDSGLRALPGASRSQRCGARLSVGRSSLPPMWSPQLGSFAPPTRLIIHLSDLHLLADPATEVWGSAADEGLARAVEMVAASGVRADVVVVTGDVAHHGEAAAYARARDAVGDLAATCGATVVWAPGNHDRPAAFGDTVTWVGGLRIIALDSTVPGHGHGALSAAQLEWLDAELATPAPEGTVIALHHPPLPALVRVFDVLALDEPAALERVLHGRDVVAVLAGHQHYPSTGWLGDIPVFTAGSLAYGVDAAAPVGTLIGVDGARSFGVVELRGRDVVQSVVSVGRPPMVAGFDVPAHHDLLRMTPAQRRSALSDERSTWTPGGGA